MKKQIIVIAMLFIACIANAQLISSSPYGSVKEQSNRFFRTGKDHTSNSNANPTYAYFDIAGLGTETITITRYYYDYDKWDDLPAMTMKKMPDGNYSNETTADEKMSYAVLVSAGGNKYYFVQSNCKLSEYSNNCRFGSLAGYFTPDKGEAKKNINTDYEAQMQPALTALNNRIQLIFGSKDNAENIERTKDVMNTLEPSGYDQKLKDEAKSLFKIMFEDELLPYEIVKIYGVYREDLISKDQNDLLPAYKYRPYIVICKDTKTGKYYDFCLVVCRAYTGGGIYEEKPRANCNDYRGVTIYYKDKKGEKNYKQAMVGWSKPDKSTPLDGPTVESMK